MPLPAYSRKGLAMKVAVSPWARAQPMTSRFSMMTSSAARSGSLRCLRLTSNCPGAASLMMVSIGRSCSSAAVADHVEQRGMFGEIVESVHAQAVGTVHGADRRRHAVVPVGTGLEQIEFELEGHDRVQPPVVHLGYLLLQHLARVGEERIALRRECLQEHLRSLWRLAQGTMDSDPRVARQ